MTRPSRAADVLLIADHVILLATALTVAWVAGAAWAGWIATLVRS